MVFTVERDRYTHHLTIVEKFRDLSPLPMKLEGNEASIRQWQQQVGVPSPETNMVGPKSNGGVRSRQPSPAMRRQDATPASAPPSRSGSTAGSDPGVIEFTKEDVDALLSERMKTKNRFNYKERCELMMDYIRRLRLCIRWFQDVEAGYVLEQEHLNEIIKSVENKCNEMEILMQTKEEELNAIIMELRKTTSLLQETCAKEESDKLAAMDDLMREQEARIAAEKLQASVSEDLEKAHQEQQSANLKISSLNDMYKRLQEYNTSLQQYNSKLQTELATANETLQRVEREKSSIIEELSTIRGQNSSLQDQLAASKTTQDETLQQKEALVNEMGLVKMELQQIKDERDRQWNQVQTLASEVTTYKEFTGQSANALDSLSNKSSELETRCVAQNELIRALQGQLAAAQKKLEMSDLSAIEARLLHEEQGKVVLELQSKLGEAEIKLLEGEKLRKKLHNTILELKGNIRVFCRVRPMIPDEVISSETKVIGFPTSTEAAGRGVDLLQNGQKHSFLFDRVFLPEAAQEDVFVEISQLVQSALDGYKVCIFAYGQTGSGKTFTMMGKPGNPEQKGLIPRSLEQIFETRQYLQSQGWKYELQVSMLEIYNETIRDLLSKPSSDSVRPESSSPGKQHIIKHDANGNTHVSDLTLVDVRSSKEVSYLLEKAAQSRSVGKTLMNEQSSRSHFVFTMRISGVNESTEQQVQGVLNLIDLAGSERLSKSGSTGDRLKETQAINKSLSSLSDVIFALAKKEDHVPFRNSKLTYLLQPCLGGDSKTLMFVNISPEISSVSESLCSLRFAARVNACEIGIPRRQTNVKYIESRAISS